MMFIIVVIINGGNKTIIVLYVMRFAVNLINIKIETKRLLEKEN
tara:strand:- start:707 stop:838 length:132 start_codon:yes stop_codon:yes gene_type:complete